MPRQEDHHAAHDAPPSEGIQGAILGDIAIERRIAKKELLVFATPEDEHVGLRDQLKRSRYFLRLARAPLVAPVPKTVAPSGFRLYTPENPLPENHDLVLQPGDAAVVSTMEHFRMPYDVTAMLGLRFQQARRGLLALMGPTADPGFGMEREGEPRDGEPLHLLLANMSTRTIALRPGEPLVSVQFMRVAETSLETRKPVNVKQMMFDEWYAESAAASPELAFISQLRDTGEQVKDVGERLNKIEDSIDRYAVFGVFAIAAALILAFVGSLAGLMKDLNIDTVNEKMPEGFWFAALGATVLVLWVVFWLPYRAFGLIRPRPARRSRLRFRFWRWGGAIRDVLVLIRPDEWTTARDVSLAAFGRSGHANRVERIALSEDRWSSRVASSGAGHRIEYDVLVERMRDPGVPRRSPRPPAQPG